MYEFGRKLPYRECEEESKSLNVAILMLKLCQDQGVLDNGIIKTMIDQQPFLATSTITERVN